MKVRLMGFAVVPGKGFSLEDFEGRIQSLADGQEKWGGHARMVRAKKKGEYFEGLVITIKDQKSFCVLKKEQQTKAYAVTVKQLEAGEQLMDFNHFVWSRVTGRGIYQHYHQSMGLNMFGGYLQDQYALMKTERIRKEIADAGGEDKVSANAVAKLKRQFKGGLTFQQIATEETLSQLVNDLAALRRVNLELTVIQKDEGSMFNAVRKYVKKRDVSLLIDPTWRESSGVKGAVLSLIKNHEIKRGTIEGLDAEERFKKLRLGENYDFYGEYDFEEVTKGMAINLLEWHKSPVLKLIHEALSDHEDTFLTPGED